MISILVRRAKHARSLAIGFGLAILASGSAASPVRADIIYGLTLDNEIFAFNSDSPGTTTPLVTITGIGSDTIVGIDWRQSNGVLYGVGVGTDNSARVYSINSATGAVTSTTNLFADSADASPFTSVVGNNFGVDFNPQVVVNGVLGDRLRVISDTGQSLRINLATGATFTDTPLSDGGAIAPSVTGIAYANNDNNIATPTTLYGIDSDDNTLVTVGSLNSVISPNTGQVFTVGSLGFDVSSFAGFDISDSGTSFAALSRTGGANAGLYTINLSTGSATLLGQIDGSVVLRGITARAVPEPGSLAMLGIGGAGWIRFMRRRRNMTPA